MNFILAVNIPFNIQTGVSYEKSEYKYFFICCPCCQVTCQWKQNNRKRLRKDISFKINPFKSTHAACTGCLHYNEVYTTKYGINPFKYQEEVKILNDQRKINIFQNNVSKSKFWKELKSKLLSNYVVWLFYLVVFYLFCSNQILSTFSSPYPVATSVLIVCAKIFLMYSNNHSTELHFTCRWSLKIRFIYYATLSELYILFYLNIVLLYYLSFWQKIFESWCLAGMLALISSVCIFFLNHNGFPGN